MCAGLTEVCGLQNGPVKGSFIGFVDNYIKAKNARNNKSLMWSLLEYMVPS